MWARLRSRYWQARLAVQQWGWAAKYAVVNVVRGLFGIPRRTSTHSIWTGRHLDARGRLRWADCGHNMLHDEGEQFFCQVLFTEEATPPAAYYLGLDNRTSLAESDTLASLSGEPSANGYSRQAVNSDATDFTISQESGDYQARTKTVTFTASGGSIGPVTKMFMATSADGTGKLVASRALSQERTLADGESLECSFYIRFSE